MIEGTRSLLAACGLDHCWWPEASACFCVIHNVTIPFVDGLTPWQLRHGSEFRGKLVPFGGLVQFTPSGPRLSNEQLKFSATTRSGLFMCY